MFWAENVLGQLVLLYEDLYTDGSISCLSYFWQNEFIFLSIFLLLLLHQEGETCSVSTSM